VDNVYTAENRETVLEPVDIQSAGWRMRMKTNFLPQITQISTDYLNENRWISKSFTDSAAFSHSLNIDRPS